MTTFLCFVFLGMLIVLSIICEHVAEWFTEKRSFYVFTIGIIYITFWAVPTYFLGWILVKKIQGE